MSRFRSAIQNKRLSLTAEIAANADCSADEFLFVCRELAPSVDGIVIGFSADGAPGVSALALASLLLRDGIDPIPRLCCRNRNRIALQSDLLGLRANGVTAIIIDRGSAHAVSGKPVYDLTRDELIATAAAMNEDVPDSNEQDFLIGTGFGLAPDEGKKITPALQAAAQSGARFLVTSPIASIEQLRVHAEQWVENRLTWHFALIVTLQIEPEQDPTELGSQVSEISQIPGISGVNLMLNGTATGQLQALTALRKHTGNALQ